MALGAPDGGRPITVDSLGIAIPARRSRSRPRPTWPPAHRGVRSLLNAATGYLLTAAVFTAFHAAGGQLRHGGLRRRRRGQRRLSQVRRRSAHDARLLGRIRRRAGGAPGRCGGFRRLRDLPAEAARKSPASCPRSPIAATSTSSTAPSGGYTMAASAHEGPPAPEGGGAEGGASRLPWISAAAPLRAAAPICYLDGYGSLQRQFQSRKRRRPADADDGAVFRDQGGQSGLPAVLPDGRLLRALLRRRGGREPRARHRADQARQARGRGHPHVRRADRARRRLSQPPDRARPSRRRLRAARRPGGGEEAGREVGRQARRRAAGDAGHDHRGAAARARPRAPPRRGPAGPGGRSALRPTVSRRSISRPARFR